MEDLYQRYRRVCTGPSDIYEHLPTLRFLAEQCDVVVEFGTRYCDSTTALLLGVRHKVVSCDWLQDYDVEGCRAEMSKLKELERDRIEFVQVDTGQIGIFEEADMLFIDSYHTYDQCVRELSLHGNKARKFLAFHDTHAFGTTGEDGGPGLLPAIEEFIRSNPHWVLKYQVDRNNGFTLLERRDVSVQERPFETQ